ncbi:hypothetical protein PROFUN_01147 [Planoprotostelium fungivorum]|uniref:FAM86 N-terminal domain-containing protein n=1 Tax=Planoprotostelium fungivorum TaxID=1890364 RepID=A0A2P6NCG7_9EUKA|nr:hypothetical protein PROFUN_01147 [Planoprotostelium fungivorum]
MGEAIGIEDALSRILRDYREMIPVGTSSLKNMMDDAFRDEKGEVFGMEDIRFQSLFYDKVINDPTIQKYPPLLRTSKDYVQALMRCVEDRHEELHEELIYHYLDLLNRMKSSAGLPSQMAAAMKEDGISAVDCYKTYQMEGEAKEDLYTIGYATTFNSVGMTTWEAGFLLAEYALDHKEQFRGKRILELGSGLGITCAVICRHLHPLQYIASDYTHTIIRNLHRNLIINDVDVGEENFGEEEWAEEGKYFFGVDEDDVKRSILVKSLDWGQISRKTLEQHSALYSPVECIVAADVLYDPDLTELFLTVLGFFFELPGERVAYVAQTMRNPSTMRHFEEKAKELSMHVEVVATEAQVGRRFRYQPTTDLAIFLIIRRDATRET